jgi:hypothetical protein
MRKKAHVEHIKPLYNLQTLYILHSTTSLLSPIHNHPPHLQYHYERRVGGRLKGSKRKCEHKRVKYEKQQLQMVESGAADGQIRRSITSGPFSI